MKYYFTRSVYTYLYIYVSSSRNFDKIDYLDRFITFSFYSSGERKRLESRYARFC